ncbi:four-carbon acid sugar kinase family protein [Ancylobacter sp. MQZ15Z-1]|uniref:Four-carbon acid sugar kinase family protein n=1 Tax=Ancylobacter mangrovi TaxID=2972472 RepID=A0A9X2PER4_9HYPH|nr:four-carbon acid sugar kinase family protein [Ancylobacter mangrovi]MCS0494625.1 four-carbon acid sugar kinase family protein [Ancylobacter mangrovi]
MMWKRIGIVGDDLTGAAAVSGAFAQRGFRCVLETADATARTPDHSAGQGAPADLLALMTESRHMPAPEARRVVASATRHLVAAGCTLFYKKIDSLLRGQVGLELQAMLDAMPGRSIMVVPATPSNGRITRDGVQTRLADADSGGVDAGAFIRARPESAHIPTLLHAAMDAQIATVALDELADPNALLRTLEDAQGRVIVCDAERAEHLHVLACAGLRAGITIFAGTSDFAAAVAEVLAAQRADEGQVLVVAGSASATSHAQLATLEEAGLGRVAWLGEAALRAGDHEGLVRDALEAAQGRPAIVVASAAPVEGGDPADAAAVAGLLAAAAADIIASRPVRGIIATGGDTTIALLHRLGVDRIEPQTLLEPGIALCAVRGTPLDGMTLVTKPGAHGDAGCLVRLVTALAARSRNNAGSASRPCAGPVASPA